jgi:predicted ArsR family transcriptional regulator
MTSLQQQARALGDPTRYNIFRYVVDAVRPVGVAELTEHFALNHNAIRQHLNKLVEAELINEQTARSKMRGRPRLEYRVDPATESRWGVTGPYERLSLLLSEIVRSGDTPLEVGRRAGRRETSDPEADAVAELMARMAVHGFEPTACREGSAVEITLTRCPFVSTAVADPETVCSLHLGIARGIAETLGGLVVDELVRHDPRVAGCRLRCHLPNEAATGA